MRNFLIKLIFGKEILSKLDEQNEVEGIRMSMNSELNESYLFDFLNFRSAFNSSDLTVPFESDGDLNDSNGNSSKKNYPRKIKIKPIDVLVELETVPTPFSLNLLDEKISILKDKEKLINQEYAKRETKALITRLTNRKKYPQFKEFFDNYQNTTDEKIDKLLSKYYLVMKSADIFIPEFPDDAVQVMKLYTAKMVELCNKKPIFYVIAEEDKFRKAYEKRDPILLVQSPFGFYWQILGAWDKEMLILHEL